MVPALRKYAYEERLKKSGLTTLKKRRERGYMIKVFKILTGRETIEKEQFFHMAENSYGLRGHTLKVRKDRSRIDIRKYFFG